MMVRIMVRKDSFTSLSGLIYPPIIIQRQRNPSSSSSALVMFLSVLLILMLLLLPPCHATTACNQDDHDSLLFLSYHLSSSSPLNWDPSTDCCLWEGVDCDGTADGRVTSLSLPFRDLNGTLAPSLVNLTGLTHLNLSHNRLYGSLPVGFFSSLRSLQVLDLSDNRLDGEIPSLDTNNPIPIKIVDLSSNHFYGELSQSSSFLLTAWNLSRLNVSNNSFAGQIPSSICNISSASMTLLDFSSNDFSGNLAPGFGECSKLEIFRAGFNNLSGMIPDDLYKATSLVHFSLPVNYLTGQISDAVVNLTNLKVLELYSNQLGWQDTPGYRQALQVGTTDASH
ncbi:LEUCINE-RICH REPEAT RECEPTOR-LIKE PROTEIN KINASE FAMILY PROTEIN-RELATED [Salix viminalis]|uniref:LEUCINE-RICH REPEAT RECEPTOR-LIKE PROTEIN KINASE FAMILY PROTEIN-RELATED n=1 Tax=Salix viminalis TaxID=40686 RepID=A0A9Q0YYX3_SALVM|nr:LEUCINE-RICH REPEAT RECEPTOR-LIKE PROTEIN KINASE FAMILY PROTEIN-RELATED [Salix viminalis]